MTALKPALVFLGLPLAAAILASATGVTQALGAHPWWGQKVIWIGLPTGLILAAIAHTLPIGRLIRVIGFALLSLAAIAVTYIGKTRFAASYAEDALAGQMWYLGWIGICALSAATLASLFGERRQKH